MLFTSTHRKGATSILAFGMAALLPGLAQGEVATAQIVPAVAPVLEQVNEQTVPAAPVEQKALEVLTQDTQSESEKRLEQDAPAKRLEDSAKIGEGMASYYGAELAGNRTANGERFNPNAMTAAHRTLPMGTKLRVTNKANGKSVIVRINDRGPFAKNRIIDVSRGAAEKISMVRSGTARVTLHKIS